MNSFDLWRVMQSSPPSQQMVVPAPFYGHPFYREFVGAEPPVAPRRGLTAAVAPVVAPATGGVSARVELDPMQVLHAEIVVDGKTYKALIDLAPAITAAMHQLAQYHASLHDGSAPAPHLAKISGDHMIGAVDQLVGASADKLVRGLVDHHVSVACGGFLDDIGNALKGAGGAALGGIQSTVSALKGPITAAAVTAATGLGGPMAGAAASQLVGPLIDGATNLGKPHPAVVAAQEAAKTDPNAALALNAAKTAVAHSITAHHVMVTAQRAAEGHPEAQQQIAQVAQDAENGDPAAHAVAPIVTHAFTEATSARRLREHGGPAREHGHGRRDRHEHGGGDPEAYRRSALHAVAQEQQRQPDAPALGYVRFAQHGSHNHKTFAFHTPDEAQQWYGALGPHIYAALFDTRSLSTPIAENFGAQ